MSYLILEDGSVFTGESFGKGDDDTYGEVVFATGMTGYQEMLTDPSFCGQIVVFTYPLIGNVGVNEADVQSGKVQVRGMIISELCREPSNWKMTQTLEAYIARYGVRGMYNVDTRALTKKLRENGSMRGVICNEPVSVDKIKEFSNTDTVARVTCKAPYMVPGSGPRVALMDYGMKQGIVRSLHELGCNIKVFPAKTSAQEVLDWGCEGIMLSNGPGNPAENTEIIANLRALIGKKPIMGICLGFQMLGLALGGQTEKLLFGHRGTNHPVKDITTGRTFITSQNHGYAVMASSLPEDVKITHLSWNDRTVEGFECKEKKLFGVQFHPEASPGPHDTHGLFKRFISLMEENRNA